MLNCVADKYTTYVSIQERSRMNTNKYKGLVLGRVNNKYERALGVWVGGWRVGALAASSPVQYVSRCGRHQISGPVSCGVSVSVTNDDDAKHEDLSALRSSLLLFPRYYLFYILYNHKTVLNVLRNYFDVG